MEVEHVIEMYSARNQIAHTQSGIRNIAKEKARPELARRTWADMYSLPDRKLEKVDEAKFFFVLDMFQDIYFRVINRGHYREYDGDEKDNWYISSVKLKVEEREEERARRRDPNESQRVVARFEVHVCQIIIFERELSF